ncbi:hypothetical protein BP6252_13567 [Coleophoma cylindrospora]|uniref:Zn(2)-C6 fungal-type domain-containing protein n=1 Tax=Coleophoma cylindrospora TaxID=1849047 RepID=A0A3D8Q8K9_9HELO|nr:hypothetical protein BP6252_13567 [Coleophoma cylindrospora]
MSFRKIRPSFGEGSASASNPNLSAAEATGPDSRRDRGEGSTFKSEGSQNSTKRRRVPESVTRNACLNCKKARAKCDGKQPCKRCSLRVETSDCVYELHIKHVKEELVQQIKDLKAKDHLTDQILQALSNGDDEHVPEILERLRNGESYHTIVEWLGRLSAGGDGVFSPRGSQHSTVDTSDYEMGGTKSSSARWTFVTSDPSILDHLLQLYFAWVHPVHTLFSEGHFVDSYKKQSIRYCSESLVNAICAMACHLHVQAPGDEVDYEQLAMAFSDAARAKIDLEDKGITGIQAIAVLFLVDCAQSKALRASSYLNMALNNLKNIAMQEDEEYSTVLKATVHGIQNLNSLVCPLLSFSIPTNRPSEWSQMTFQAPAGYNLAQQCTNDVEDGDAQLDKAKWYLYRHPGDRYPSAWPGLLATTNREKTKLMKIVHEIVTVMYARQGPQSAAVDILQLYARLLRWREALPEELQETVGSKSNPLPHILSLLILYENTVVQLLRPLLDLDGFPSSLVEEVIWSHSQHALYLLEECYQQRFTCRYQPVLQMFAILHLTDVVMRFFPHAVSGTEEKRRDGARAVQLAMECLMQSRAGMPIAGPMQEMLRRAAIECSMTLPSNLAELMAPAPVPSRVYLLDDLIDACTRPSYVQPVSDIHQKYMPSFASDWVTIGGPFGFREPRAGGRGLRARSAEERGAQSLMQIRNLLNEN